MPPVPASAPIRIGTRGSALAIVQAESVAHALRSAGAATEIVTITTLGDRGAAVADKSRWVSELERALLDDRIDVAVHSAKDVPTELAPGTELAAVPPRADPRDVICGAAGLHALAPGDRVGTVSLRRAAQIHAARPDLEVTPLRGNVDTRLRKLADGEVEAIVVALAGLQRLGRAAEATATIDEVVPAAGQGALLVQARTAELDAALAAAITDPVSLACVSAERVLVHALGADCHTPVGAYARPIDGSGDRELELVGWVGMPDGSAWLRDSVTGAPAAVGAACAERMLAAGAAQLLADATAEAIAAGDAGGPS